MVEQEYKDTLCRKTLERLVEEMLDNNGLCTVAVLTDDSRINVLAGAKTRLRPTGHSSALENDSYTCYVLPAW